MYGTFKKLDRRFTGRSRAALPLLFLIIVLVGCEKPIAKVGVVLPLTGPDAALGEAARQGIEASLATLDGSSITLETLDSASDPAQAAEQAAALIESGAVAVVGGVTPAEARSLAKAVDAREKVLILPSASEQALSQDSKWVYRLAASDAEAGAAFATFAARRFKNKTAVVLAGDAAYAAAIESGFVPTFQSLGGELLTRLESDASDLTAKAREIAELAPELAVLSGDAAWQHEAAAKLRQVGYKGHLFAGRHLMHPAMINDLAPIPDLLFAHSGFDPAAPQGDVQSFAELFEEHHGRSLEDITAQVSAEAWDALRILDLALRDRPVMASEIRRGLRDQVKSYAGASGSLEFDDTGAVTAFPRVYSLNADGSLRDHGAFLDVQEEQIAAERRALQEQLRNLQAQMQAQSDGPT